MDIVTLAESAAAPRKKGRRWLVTVAVPGQGATGFYPEDVLRETGPASIPPGTKAFFKHAKPEDRDVRDMVGTYPDGAFWNEEENELQAYLEPFPRFESVLDEAGSNVEASIRVAARKDANGVVRELVYNRANTVDLVPFGGLEGSGLKYQVESLFAAAAADGEEGKEKNMEITKEMWDAQNALITNLVTKFDTFVSESKQELQGKADAEALDALVAAGVEEALASYREKEEAIDKADILSVQKESFKARALAGEDIAADLADAVKFVEEARKEFSSTSSPKVARRGNVVVVEESASDPSANKQTLKVGRWSN